jgi:hypothetical protein
VTPGRVAWEIENWCRAPGCARRPGRRHDARLLDLRHAGYADNGRPPMLQTIRQFESWWPMCFAAWLVSGAELHPWSLTPFPHPRLNLPPQDCERSNAIDLIVGPMDRTSSPPVWPFGHISPVWHSHLLTVTT